MNYVGLDVHDEYCQAAILDEKGKLLEEKRIPTNEAGLKHLARSIDKGSSLTMEASSSFYVPYEFFSGRGYEVKVAHPLKVKAIADARIKTDKIDAKTLAHLLRADLIPETYMPEKPIRQLREMISHRDGMVNMRTQEKNRVQSMLTRRGLKHGFSDVFGKGGTAWLKSLELDAMGRLEMDQHLGTIAHLDKMVDAIEEEIFAYEKVFPETQMLQSIPGVGRLIAITLMAGIVDINRFADEKKLASYAGLTPSVHQSGNVDRHGKITKQGNKMVRAAIMRAVQKAIVKETKIRRFFLRIEKRHGTNKAKVATGRKILCWIYFMLKRGETFAA